MEQFRSKIRNPEVYLLKDGIMHYLIDMMNKYFFLETLVAKKSLLMFCNLNNKILTSVPQMDFFYQPHSYSY